MNKRIQPSCVFYALVCFLACGLLWGQFSPSPARNRGLDFFPGLGGGQDRHSHGFFVGSSLPFLKPPRLGHPSSRFGVRRGHHGGRHYPRAGDYFPGLVYWGGKGESNSYSSQNFVEEWSRRDPPDPKRELEGLEASPLLHEGMSEEEVSMILGSPLRKSVSEGREDWHYSSYILTFEDGALIGLKE